MRRTGRLLLLLLLLPVACAGPDPDAPLPQWLSELGVLERRGGALWPVDGMAYDLGHPLFSDYAAKFRTIHLPAGHAAWPGGDADTVLAFPVGSVITKTFYYREPQPGRVLLAPADGLAGPDTPLDLRGVRLLETRILRHRSDGWEAVAYLWDDSGRDARRLDLGALLPLTGIDGRAFDYLVPDRNQCAACHAGGRSDRTLQPLGPTPGNLAARRFDGGSDSLRHLQQAGLVEASVEGGAWPVEADARAYLDVNCGHCHRGDGSAASAGLDLRRRAPLAAMGLCKPPVAAGRGSGGLRVDIWPGRPEASILVHRMRHDDPAVMMPELGRSLVHDEGVHLVTAWIRELEGDCRHAGLL